jgi:hypothetical protein
MNQIMRRTLTGPSLLFSGLVTGCASETGGIEGDAPTIHATLEQTIGLEDGPEEYVFGRISGITVDDEERIYVADQLANTVRVFDTAGRFLFTIGRQGSGPGEFSGPCCVAFGPDGLLWVRDAGAGRYNAYAVGQSDAEYVTQRRMSHNTRGFWQATTFDAEGRLIDVGVQAMAAPPPVVTRFHLDANSTPVRTVMVAESPPDSIGEYLVERETSDGVVVFYYQQPYGPRKLVGHSPLGEWAEAISGSYAVLWHQPDTALLITGHVTPPEISAEEHQRAEESLTGRLRRSGLTLGDLPFGIPDRKPPLAWLHFDLEGRLWVELSVAAGDPRQAHVYERSGNLVAEVAWPGEVDRLLVYLELSAAFGVGRDSLGVERVARLRFDR